MATQSVTDKIISDAQQEAQEILAQYRQEAGKIADELAGRRAARQARLEKEIAERRDTETMRAVSQRKLALNMKRTEHRQQLMRAIIEEAVSSLPGHKDYLSFLQALITKSGAQQGELRLSRADLERYRGDLEKFLKREGRTMKLVADAGMKGGVLINDGTTSYIGSLDIIIELIGDEMAIALAGILDQGSERKVE